MSNRGNGTNNGNKGGNFTINNNPSGRYDQPSEYQLDWGQKRRDIEEMRMTKEERESLKEVWDD